MDTLLKIIIALSFSGAEALAVWLFITAADAVLRRFPKPSHYRRVKNEHQRTGRKDRPPDHPRTDCLRNLPQPPHFKLDTAAYGKRRTDTVPSENPTHIPRMGHPRSFGSPGVTAIKKRPIRAFSHSDGFCIPYCIKPTTGCGFRAASGGFLPRVPRRRVRLRLRGRLRRL